MEDGTFINPEDKEPFQRLKELYANDASKMAKHQQNQDDQIYMLKAENRKLKETIEEMKYNINELKIAIVFLIGMCASALINSARYVKFVSFSPEILYA